MLYVLCARAQNREQTQPLLRAMRRLLACTGSEDGVMLLVAPAPAHAARLPEDDAFIRALQSGVMSLDSRCPQRCMLLVCSRTWCDARRQYVCHDPVRTLCAVLSKEQADARFSAASVSPASLAGRYDCVFFLNDGFSCPPGMAQRLCAHLRRRHIICGLPLPAYAFPPSPLAHLMRTGFFLNAMTEIRSCGVLGEPTVNPLSQPAFAADAHGLLLLAQGKAFSAPVSDDCLFPALTSPDTHALLRHAREEILDALLSRKEDPLFAAFSLIPLCQCALLLLSGALGLPWLAALCVLLPQAPLLLRPSRLPGALVRLALLPACACCALDAYLCASLARSPLLRLRVPRLLQEENGCVFLGAALFACAMYGAKALTALLPLALLWLSAPLLFPALSMPPRERIPLSAEEMRQMTDRAKAALSSLAEKEAGAYAALCACAGCMLGLLEPDEAARRAQAAAAAPQTPAQQAALLCAAQYVREQMSRCDAALRSLPSVLETLAMSVSFPNAPGVLGALLRADIGTLTPSPPEDALFIPAALAADAAKNHALMPLAAPHTALRRVAAPPASPLAALALADAVLGRPFEALMLRSPISGPLMPLLSFVPLPHAHKDLLIKRAG